MTFMLSHHEIALTPNKHGTEVYQVYQIYVINVNNEIYVVT